MKVVSIVIAATALAGCAANYPICGTEDPAYTSEIHKCLGQAPELRKFLLEGYDIRRCREQAATKGLYARNDRACLDPVHHADLIRQSGR